MTNKYFLKKYLNIIVKGIFVFLIIIVTFILALNTTYVLGSQPNYTIEDYINSDTLINRTNYNIRNYASDLYNSEAKIMWEIDSPPKWYSFRTTNYTNDDPIVEIVPKSYFTSICNELIIGKEYGFYINTRFGETGFYISSVLVFDINTNTDLDATIDRVIIQIKPIFQFEYLVILENTSSILIGSTIVNTNSINEKRVLPKPTEIYVAESTDYYPVLKYGMTEKYYLKDISFGARLFNEQELNHGDTGYNPYNDYGSYFTGFDYSYEGKYREYGEFPTEDLVWNILDTVSWGLGTFWKNPYVEIFTAIYDGISVANSWVEFAEDCSRFYNGYVENIEHRMTARPYFQNRDDQLNHYRDIYNNPTLMKQAGLAINTSEEKSIWFGINDNLTAYYTIGHSALNGMEPWFTRMVSEIAIKVVAENGDHVVKTASNITSYYLREPVNKNTGMDKSEIVSLLPYGENYYEFNAVFASKYEVKVQASKSVNIHINGTTYTGNVTIPISISANSKINIKITSNGVFSKGTITISPSTTLTNHTISGNAYYIVKISGISGVQQIATNNTNIIISGLYKYGYPELIRYVDFGYFEADDYLTYPFKNTESHYYVVLKNVGGTTRTGVALTISDVDVVAEGTTKNIRLTPNIVYYKFTTSSISGQYIQTITNAGFNNLVYSVLDSNLNILSTGYSNTFGEYIMSLAANKIYYIGATNYSDVANAQVVINRSANAYKWKISGGEYGSGTDVTGTKVFLKRGVTYTLQFWINNKINNAPVFIVDDEYNIYGGYGLAINQITGQMFISKNTPIGGSGVTIKACYAGNLDLSYNYTLTVIPEYENPNITMNVTNHDDIAFSAVLPRYVQMIEYSVSVGLNSLPESYTVSNYNIENTININVLDLYKRLGYTDARYFTIKITKIHIKTASGTTNPYDVSFSTTAHSLFKSGDGTSGNPYLISSYRHLNNIRNAWVWVYDYGPSEYIKKITSHFKLTNSITLSGVWTPIAYSFGGELDGNGYEIKNMFIEIPSTKFGNDDYRLYGFFSMISNGKVKNLKLTDIYIHGNTQHEGGYTFVGGIAGSNFFSTITNSSVSGYMYVYRYNSLMVELGANQGSRIENCIVNMTISSYGEVGGITGVSDYSVIDNCKFYGTINWRYANKDNFGFNNAGGIVGRAAAGKILNSKNYGAIQYDGISTESRTLQPCIAEIVGYTESGVTLSGNGRYGSVSWGNLKKVTWKTGIWPFRTTHNHIQYQYVTTSQVGYSA